MTEFLEKKIGPVTEKKSERQARTILKGEKNFGPKRGNQKATGGILTGVT